MCGIDGIISKNKINLQTLKEMNECLKHRGPDSEGIFQDENVGLAMRRLKVIDLETGDQPIFNETKTIVCIFNGEIYNFKYLRDELERKGHVFESKTDTEILVHGYEEWGINELLSRLNGMFAFCIYDKTKRKVILARDRIGEKPLYYFFNQNDFIFASELRSILRSNKVPLEISKSGLYCYLAVHYVPGDMCIIKNVRKLLPGHYLELDVDSLSFNLVEYWDLKERNFVEREYDEYVSYVKKLVEDAIMLRTVSDVPLGVFLSGGIDSSILVSVLSKHISKIDSFSIGFKDQEYDESNYSNLISKTFKTNHHQFVLDPEMIPELLSKITFYMDEPSGDQALLPLFWLSHEAKKYVTVVLGGEGGDEVFAGYSYYPKDNFPKKGFFNDSEPLTGFLHEKEPITHSNFPVIADFHTRSNLIKDFEVDEIKNEIKEFEWLQKFQTKLSNISDYLRQCQYADIKTWLPDDLLMKFDKMSMSTSLEGRAPYLDYRLVEFGFNLPHKYKINKDFTKVILREAFSDSIPKVIYERDKQGFNLPMSKWLKTKLQKLLLTTSKLKQNDGIDNEYFQKLIDEHISGKAERARLLYAILVYKLWFKNLATSINYQLESIKIS